MTKRNKQQSKLIRPPQMYINAAVIIGGVIGFFVQDAMNLDNVGAFLVTALFCFLGVIILNFGWLFYVRSQEGK